MSAGRSEWAAQLSYLIWIETPREERLRRGVERDGIAALSDPAQIDTHNDATRSWRRAAVRPKRGAAVSRTYRPDCGVTK